MRLICSYSYRFFPVGQGLFASGRVLPSGGPVFDWVYDCGTDSGKPLLSRAITTYKEAVSRIDLLVISHFDRDHVLGIAELLSGTYVGTLLLPYAPLWQRLLIALHAGAETEDDMMQFAIDPVTYLTSRENTHIERIIFVLPSGDEGPATTFDGPIKPWPKGTRDPEHWPLKEDLDLDWQAPDGDTFTGDGLVYFLKPGSRIVVCGFWEFVPYNDQTLATAHSFQGSIQRRAKELLDAKDEPSRREILRLMKVEYHSQFNTQSDDWANEISLFLYSGPVIPATSNVSFRCWRTTRFAGDWPWSCDEPIFGPPERAAIVYTGDGYLNEPARLNRLTCYLGNERISRTALFQVMHHGSKYNWHANVAPAVGSVASVFSSDPTRSRPSHPHQEVLQSFSGYGPLQVDKDYYARACGSVLVS